MPIGDRASPIHPHFLFSQIMATVTSTPSAGGSAAPPTGRRFRPRFHLRVLGSAAPVFPGFEVDILDRVPDDEKPEAVWHRDRARAISRAHPEVRKLFGHSPSTAFFCLL